MDWYIKRLAKMNRVTKSSYDRCYKCLEDELAKGEFGELLDFQQVESVEKEIQRLTYMNQEMIEAGLGPLKRMRALYVARNSFELATKFDSSDAAYVLEEVVAGIRNAARVVQLKVELFPLYSVIPTGDVNAQAIRLDCCSQPFLLLDSNFFIFANLFSKAFLMSVPVVDRKDGQHFDLDPERVKHHIVDNPVGLQQMFELFLAYKLTGNPKQSRSFPVPKRLQHFVWLVRSSMESFIVGHEFAHAYLHLDHNKEIKVPDGLSKRHFIEYQADSYGLDLAVVAMHPHGSHSILTGLSSMLYFFALEMCDRYDYVVKHGTDEGYESQGSETHPSFEQRLAILSMKLAERHQQDPVTLKQIQSFNDVFEIFWGAFKLILIDFKLRETIIAGDDFQ